jgi:hypothetical protein
MSQTIHRSIKKPGFGWALTTLSPRSRSSACSACAVEIEFKPDSEEWTWDIFLAPSFTLPMTQKRLTAGANLAGIALLEAELRLRGEIA